MAGLARKSDSILRALKGGVYYLMKCCCYSSGGNPCTYDITIVATWTGGGSASVRIALYSDGAYHSTAYQTISPTTLFQSFSTGLNHTYGVVWQEINDDCPHEFSVDPFVISFTTTVTNNGPCDLCVNGNTVASSGTWTSTTTPVEIPCDDLDFDYLETPASMTTFTVKMGAC